MGSPPHDALASTHLSHPSPRAKRRKIISSPDEQVKAEDPSLSKATDDMHRSSTPPGSAANIKFTKTGRVSKATKGERVHACDECGKVYTRAEHLRRHKKNHNPGTLPCDWPGCGRSFFREDLLQRHKQRHADNGSSPRSRGSSTYRARNPYDANARGEYTERRVLGNTIVGNLPHETGSAVRTASEAAPTERPYHAPPLHNLSSAMPLSQKTTSGYRPFELNPRRRIASVANVSAYGSTATSEWMSPRRNSSPIRHISPHQPYYSTHGPHRGHGNEQSYDPYPYPNASRSPASAESMPVMTTVGEDHVGLGGFGASGTPTSDGSAGPPVRHSLYETPVLPGLVTVNLDERDLTEQQELQTPMAVITAPEHGSDIGQTVYECEERFIEAYWQTIHVLWPVVHRPTFNNTRNPLLKAALVALGAHSTGDPNDLTPARQLNEKCIKVLKKRTNTNSHSYRICDMQAVVLVELYSLYRARRASLRLTSCFEQVYKRLANDPDANPAQHRDYNSEDFSDMLSGLSPEVRKEAKRRLLAACYILDQQNSAFFGRQATELNLPVSWMPFPQPANIWDATSGASASTAYGSQTMDTAEHEYTYEALNTVNTHEHPSTSPYDVFRSSFLISAMRDVADGRGESSWKPLDDAEASALLYVVDHSPRTQLAYHLFMLCKNTPVRDLLAVAGETWIMAEKISSQAAYKAAQSETTQWVSNPQSLHHNALYHSLQILDLVRTNAMQGLLYREWAVYMATLVVWITSYISNEGSPRGRAGTMTPHELDRVVLAVTDAGPSTMISWNDASNILLWTQIRLEAVSVPNHCGLVNNALDVINKLVSRGHEEGWLQ